MNKDAHVSRDVGRVIDKAMGRFGGVHGLKFEPRPVHEDYRSRFLRVIEIMTHVDAEVDEWHHTKEI